MATCTSDKVARSLALNYGVYTSIVPVLKDTDTMVSMASEKTKDFFKLESGDKIIITGGIPVSDKGRITNFIKIEEID